VYSARLPFTPMAAGKQSAPSMHFAGFENSIELCSSCMLEVWNLGILIKTIRFANFWINNFQEQCFAGREPTLLYSASNMFHIKVSLLSPLFWAFAIAPGIIQLQWFPTEKNELNKMETVIVLLVISLF